MVELYNKLKELELIGIYKWVIDNNGSFNLPYHNNFHLENVTLFALKGCEYYSVPSRYQVLVATAGLFHDINHSGSGKNDDLNILESVKVFLDFNADIKYFEDEEEKFIINLIKATRFPYTNKCEDLNLYQQILRDSDIIQGPFCQNYINGVMMAIARENNVKSIDDVIEGQIKFLNSATFCTEWATDLYKSVVDKTLEKVKLFAKN